jgi:hypothetical protein
VAEVGERGSMNSIHESMKKSHCVIGDSMATVGP